MEEMKQLKIWILQDCDVLYISAAGSNIIWAILSLMSLCVDTPISLLLLLTVMNMMRKYTEHDFL